MTEELERLGNAPAEEEKTSKAGSISSTPRKSTEQELQEVDPAEPLEEEDETERDFQTDLVDGVEEEEKKDRMSVEVFKERVQTMLSWYQLDNNEDPPVYRLLAPRLEWRLYCNCVSLYVCMIAGMYACVCVCMSVYTSN